MGACSSSAAAKGFKLYLYDTKNGLHAKEDFEEGKRTPNTWSKMRWGQEVIDTVKTYFSQISGSKSGLGFHKFLVLKTSDNKYYSVEKNDEGIVVQRSVGDEGKVVNYLQGEKRTSELFIVEDPRSGLNIMHIVQEVMKERFYDLLIGNCIHFVNKLKEKFCT